MDWLRCNKCYYPMKSANSPFTLTQCGHIYCEKCLVNDNYCPECKVSGIQSMLLKPPLPPQITHLFTDFLHHLDILLAAAKFQTSQMIINQRRLNELLKKYCALKEAYWMKSKQLEKLKVLCNELYRAKKKCEATCNQRYQAHKVPGSVNSHRGYYTPHLYSSNQRNVPNSGQDFHNQPQKSQMSFQFNKNNHYSGYHSDTSDKTTSTVRAQTPKSVTPMMVSPDGLFRIPNVRKVPRSTGASSNNSGKGGRTLANMKVF